MNPTLHASIHNQSELLLTVAGGCATSSEHSLILLDTQMKREHVLRIWEKEGRAFQYRGLYFFLKINYSYNCALS